MLPWSPYVVELNAVWCLAIFNWSSWLSDCSHLKTTPIRRVEFLDMVADLVVVISCLYMETFKLCNVLQKWSWLSYSPGASLNKVTLPNIFCRGEILRYLWLGYTISPWLRAVKFSSQWNTLYNILRKCHNIVF